MLTNCDGLSYYYQSRQASYDNGHHIIERCRTLGIGPPFTNMV